MPVSSQIGKGIAYFRSYYDGLDPAFFLSYEREAVYALDGGAFRLTFDLNILGRTSELNLGSPVYGTPLLEDGQTLMEIKTPGGLPLWMSHALNRLAIYPTSFSKSGRANGARVAKRQKTHNRRKLSCC